MATPVADSIPALVTGNNGNGTLTEEFISGLVQGGSWQFAGPRTITYSLDFNFDGPSQAWTPEWTGAIANAFSAWSAVANVSFVLAGTPNGEAQNLSAADIALALAPGEGEDAVLGFGIFPDPEFADLVLAETGYLRATYPRPEGDITFDSAHYIFNVLSPGSQGFEVLLHEIGHALGLKHPDDDGGNSRPTFSALGIDEYDRPLQTLMTTLTVSFGATPGPLDILAIQHIYGANMTYRAGDDIYSIAGSDSRTIWDAGGTDTFDASQSPSGVTLDLRPGSFSYAVGTTAIAYNVTIEHAIGGAGHDLITGNAVANSLSGGTGNDTLDGGAGVDTLVGGTGNDTYVIDAAADVLVEAAGQGTDTIRSSVSRSLTATFENLVLLGADNLAGSGNAYANSITGNSGNNVLNGGGGNDTLAGGGGSDTLTGGAGNDVYINPAGDVVTEAATGGTDTVRSVTNAALAANIEALVLTGATNSRGTGNGLANHLQGNSGRNRLDGGGGNDTLIGGPGQDTLIGGAGNDHYQAVTASDVVIEAPDGGVDTVESRAFATTLSANVENLVLNYFSYENIVTGIGNDLANRIEGNEANDRLNGMGGDDTLVGNENFDTLIGGAGDDFLSGGYDDDVLNGGGGNDTLVGGEAQSVFYDNDTLDGGAGDDVMSGRGFNDVYVVDSAGDVVIEQRGDGTDTVLSSVAYVLTANVEHLVLTGSGDLSGTGNARNNRISGNAGNNVLDGGPGPDTLVGGAGNDTYVLANALPPSFFEMRLEGSSFQFEPVFFTPTFETDLFDSNLDADSLVDTVVMYHSMEGDGYASFSTRMLGIPFQVGVYQDVEGQAPTPGHAGIFLAVNGVSPSFIDASFEVLAAEFDYSGPSPQIVDLLIEFDLDRSPGHWIGRLSINHAWEETGDNVVESPGGGTDTVETPYSYTLTTNVENLLLTGAGSVSGTGNASNNIIRGNAANNVLAGAGGSDVLKGMGGSDTLIWDPADILIHGGTGTDTLKVNGGNLDLTIVANSKVIDVETIDLTGGGNNILALNTLDVMDFSTTTNVLKVLGDAGDSIDIVPAFTDQGIVSGFHRYTFGGATLLVDLDITSVA